jgi:hypothetical protein
MDRTIGTAIMSEGTVGGKSGIGREYGAFGLESFLEPRAVLT